MPEEKKVETTETSKGSEGTTETTEGTEEKVIDNKIPYERFKKINDDNKVLKEQLSNFEKDKTEAEKKRLENEGKWQEAAELAEKKATEAEAKATKADALRIEKMQEFEIGIEAKNQGINDVNDAIKLINSSDIVINDDGTFTGIKESIEKLKTEKPYLFSDENSTNVGVHSDKAKGRTMTTREELLSDPIAATKLKKDNPAEFKRILGS